MASVCRVRLLVCALVRVSLASGCACVRASVAATLRAFSTTPLPPPLGRPAPSLAPALTPGPRRSATGGTAPGPVSMHRESSADLLFLDAAVPPTAAAVAPSAPTTVPVVRPPVAAPMSAAATPRPLVVSAPVVQRAPVGRATVLFDYRKKLADEIDLHMHEAVCGAVMDGLARAPSLHSPPLHFPPLFAHPSALRDVRPFDSPSPIAWAPRDACSVPPVQCHSRGRRGGQGEGVGNGVESCSTAVRRGMRAPRCCSFAGCAVCMPFPFPGGTHS
jgi:hypothetical protein